MGNMNISILLWVVMVLLALYVNDSLSLSVTNQVSQSQQKRQIQQHHQQQVDKKEELDFEERPELINLSSGSPSERLAKLKALEVAASNPDDDHSNIELERLDDGVRYEMLPEQQPPSSEYYNKLRNDLDIYNMARLYSKMRSLNRGASDFLKNQVDRKRSVRPMALTREDKDYSFVMQPSSTMNKYTLAGRATKSSSGSLASRWAEQKLRDMILANGQSFRYSNNGQDLDQQSRALNEAPSSDFDINNGDYIDDIILKNREKRRRCKIDPNLSVKNPSFCDTDAYFGAADYSMRDVWDSAGRRR